MAPRSHAPARAGLLALIALAVPGCAAKSTAWTNEYVDRNGVLRDRETFDFRPDGLPARHGPATYFHANGEPLCRGEFRDGVRQGDWRWYFPDGALWQAGSYERGAPTGVWTRYDPNGAACFRGEIRDGEPVGQWVLFHEPGVVWARGRFEGGVPDGPWISVGHDGQVLLAQEFRGGLGSGPRGPTDNRPVRTLDTRWWLKSPSCALPLPPERRRTTPRPSPSIRSEGTLDGTCTWHPSAGSPPIPGEPARTGVERLVDYGWISTALYERGTAVRWLTDAEIEELRNP